MKLRTHTYCFVILLGIAFLTAGVMNASGKNNGTHKSMRSFSICAIEQSSNTALDNPENVSLDRIKQINFTPVPEFNSYSISYREDIFIYGHGSALFENSIKLNAGFRTILKI